MAANVDNLKEQTMCRYISTGKKNVRASLAKNLAKSSNEDQIEDMCKLAKARRRTKKLLDKVGYMKARLRLFRRQGFKLK
jgi:hypothetical protein